MKPRKLLNVLPECYVDTNLIEYLLNAGVNHQHCCSKVVGQLKTTFADKFAVGIIDKDKVQLGYIKECEVVAASKHLILMKHSERCQYLITIAPAIDGFVLDCAKEQGVNVGDYELPSRLEEFTKVSKSVTSNADKRFKALFSAISGNGEVKLLKMVLKYLCENRYATDVKQLVAMFKRV